MSRKNLVLVALAVAVYLLFVRKRAPAKPVLVTVGDVGPIETIA